MLYSITIVATSSRDDGYEEWIVEAPVYQMAYGHPKLKKELTWFAEDKAREASICWGVEVDVEVASYFPARVGYVKDNGSCMRSVLVEFKRLYKRQVAS